MLVGARKVPFTTTAAVGGGDVVAGEGGEGVAGEGMRSPKASQATLLGFSPLRVYRPLQSRLSSVAATTRDHKPLPAAVVHESGGGGGGAPAGIPREEEEQEENVARKLGGIAFARGVCRPPALVGISHNHSHNHNNNSSHQEFDPHEKLASPATLFKLEQQEHDEDITNSNINNNNNNKTVESPPKLPPPQPHRLQTSTDVCLTPRTPPPPPTTTTTTTSTTPPRLVSDGKFPAPRAFLGSPLAPPSTTTSATSATSTPSSTSTPPNAMILGPPPLFIFDLDMTLCTPDREIPLCNRECLKRLRQAGALIALASFSSGAEAVLRSAGVECLFDVVACGWSAGALKSEYLRNIFHTVGWGGVIPEGRSVVFFDDLMENVVDVMHHYSTVTGIIVHSVETLPVVVDKCLSNCLSRAGTPPWKPVAMAAGASAAAGAGGVGSPEAEAARSVPRLSLLTTPGDDDDDDDV